MTNALAGLAHRLMRSVVNSGAVSEVNADVACRVMREEMKAFLTSEKYADERALITNLRGAELAFASLVAECVRRTIIESATLKTI